MSNNSQLYDAKAKGAPDDELDRLLSSGRYIVPLFWLASATNDHLLTGKRDGEKITYLEIPLDSALATFKSRASALSSIAAGISEHFDAWLSLLSEVSGGYLKIDPTEVLDMAGTDPSEISLAVGFFDKPSVPAFKALLSLTCLTDVIEGFPSRLRHTAVIGGVEGSTPVSSYLLGSAESPI